MRRPVLSDIDLDRYAGLIDAMVEPKCGVALRVPPETHFWKAGAELDNRGKEWVAQLPEDAPTGEALVQPLGDNSLLLAVGMRLEAEAPLAWLLVWTQLVPGSPEAQRLQSIASRVASFLEREWTQGTELSSALSELSSRYEELNLVYHIEKQARNASESQLTLQLMLAGFTQHLPVDVAMFLETGDERRSSVQTLGSRPIANIDLVLTEMRGKLARFVVAARKPVIINDADDPRRSYLFTGLPFKILAWPSTGCRGTESMVILLRDLSDPDFTNAEVNLAKVFVGQASIILRNQALMERMRRFTQQMASSLVEAVEAKDPYTRGHSERVERIADGLGRGLELSQQELEDLYWGALLHDIGKIGIPDAILSKSGKLTPDEYTFIKTHPQRSYEILRHIEHLGETALDGARYHQERFDGGGYPFGLAGEDIPLPARIVAVADTYDAITSSRSYRAAVSHDRAMDIIEDVAGTQLDPRLVEIFCRLVSEDDAWLAQIRPNRDE